MGPRDERPGAGPPGEDRGDGHGGPRGDGRGPGSGGAAWGPVVVPDDARDLEPDRVAYLRELRAGGRRPPPRIRGWRGLVLTRRWQRYGLSGPIVVAVLLAVACVGSLAVLVTPRSTPRPPAAPLSTGTSASAGAVGGLLPDVRLDGAAPGAQAARDLRPGVVALVPKGCGCPRTLDDVFRAAEAFRLRTWLVTSPDGGRELRAEATRVGHGGAAVLTDPSGVLARASSAAGVTLLLVHADGVLDSVVRGARPGMPLESHLVRLAQPGLPR